uniref:Uncharacterized protein n=1 Tax=Oryza meridionalis TaxID=40149 RepID=A0A0E0DN55_9ORYZ
MACLSSLTGTWWWEWWRGGQRPKVSAWQAAKGGGHLVFPSDLSPIPLTPRRDHRSGGLPPSSPPIPPFIGAAETTLVVVALATAVVVAIVEGTTGELHKCAKWDTEDQLVLMSTFFGVGVSKLFAAQTVGKEQ